MTGKIPPAAFATFRASAAFVAIVAFVSFAGSHALADDGGAAPEGALAGVPRAPAEGGPRRWQVATDGPLDVRDAPSVDAPGIGVAGAGDILSNLGCEAVESGVWCRVESLRGRVRGHVPAASLRPAVGPDGAVATGADDSVRRARRGDFDARGRIRCAQERGQAMGECTADVARGGGGDAAVVARFANGFGRTLRFVHGRFVSADATMSGSGSDIDWKKEGDVHVVRVDDQRYELSDELVFGF